MSMTVMAECPHLMGRYQATLQKFARGEEAVGGLLAPGPLLGSSIIQQEGCPIRAWIRSHPARTRTVTTQSPTGNVLHSDLGIPSSRRECP